MPLQNSVEMGKLNPTKFPFYPCFNFNRISSSLIKRSWVFKIPYFYRWNYKYTFNYYWKQIGPTTKLKNGYNIISSEDWGHFNNTLVLKWILNHCRSCRNVRTSSCSLHVVVPILLMAIWSASSLRKISTNYNNQKYFLTVGINLNSKTLKLSNLAQLSNTIYISYIL